MLYLQPMNSNLVPMSYNKFIIIVIFYLLRANVVACNCKIILSIKQRIRCRNMVSVIIKTIRKLCWALGI